MLYWGKKLKIIIELSVTITRMIGVRAIIIKYEEY
jgi:hypothetical protein